jgi:hypothetical protein
MSDPAKLRWAGADAERLRVVARVCDYKKGWIWRRLAEARGAGAAEPVFFPFYRESETA